MKNVIRILFYFMVSVSIATGFGCDIPDDESICSYAVSNYVYPEGNRSSAQVFYPCTIQDMAGQFDATTVTGGATNTKEDMYWLAEYLTGNGNLVVIAVSASSNLSISSYESAHKAGVGILKSEDNNRNSPLYNKLGKIAVMGYSMGGAGALQAAHDLGSTIDAAIGLAPWSTSSYLSGISVPTMVIVGSRDTTASPTMVHNTFEDLPSGLPKAYAEVYGETHFFWVNNRDGAPADEYILAWLKYYLSDDYAYYGTLSDPPSGIVDYEFEP